MTHSNAALDSSHALKKYFYPQQTPGSASAPNPASMLEERAAWPLNTDWQLARDPSHLTDSPSKKRRSLPKGVERKIWAKPAMVELTKRAVQAERAKVTAIKYNEKLKAKRTQEKLEKPPERAPLWKPKTQTPAPVIRRPKTQAVHRWRNRAVRTERVKASGLNCKGKPAPKPERAPLWKPKYLPSVSTAPRPQPVRPRQWRNARRRNILVVDAKTEPWQRPRETRGGADQPVASLQESQRLRMSGRLKKSYGVPLCSRPTKIMGMGYPYSRQMQMRQEQLYQQPEYRDQYRRMLHQQQRQQEMRQLEQHYGQAGGKMASHPYAILSQHHQQHQHQHQLQIQQQLQANPPYAVPQKPPVKRLKGRRLCGNFYYD